MYPDATVAAKVLARLEGVESVQPAGPQAHAESGELRLTAAPGAWFAYPWWEDAREAPDYASHVDIHSKIGFDPCELFWGIPPVTVSLDASRVRGTHGRTDTPACFAETIGLEPDPADLPGLAAALQAAL